MTDDLIVTPEFVEANLDRIRVIDCSVWFETRPVGASTIHGGRDRWLEGHIPGAAYLHMVDDLSDPDGAYPFAIAPQDRIDRVLSEIGIEPGDTVVLYGAGTPVAVTRAWWVLSVSGLADVRIMDGGWQRWTAEGRPVATGEERFAPSRFRAARDESAVADRESVRRAMESGDTLLVNALTRPQFEGTGGTHYGRPGRIPGSVCIAARSLTDPAADHRFRPLEALRAEFEAAGALSKPQVITYCGGGIAASGDAFILHLLGQDNVQVYDASLQEWARSDLPMETG